MENTEETKELDNVAPKKVTLMIKGKEREIRFSFSAWRDIEREYGGMDNLDKLQKQMEETPFATIPHLIYIALKDKDGLDEETLLDEYDLTDLKMITEKLTTALYGSLPPEDETKKEAVTEAK